MYTGEWASDKKAGTGKYTGASELAGSWKHGKLGSGEWIFPDGSCYKGEFAGGKPTGVGKYVMASGNAQTGSYSAIVSDPDDPDAPKTGGEWVPASEVTAAFAADLAVTAVPATGPVEQTYAMIKPNAVAAGATEAILDAAQAAGFKVVAKETASLTTAQAEEFYGEHAGKGFFGDLVSFMTSGPVVKLILEKEGAILGWRALLGPTNSLTAKTEAPKSIRALYGIDGTQNAAHGSDSTESSAREIGLMLPTTSTLAIVAPYDDAPAGEAKAIQLLKAAGFTVSRAPMPVSASQTATVTGMAAEGILAAPEEEGGAEKMLTKLVLTAPGAVVAALSMELKAELAFCYFSPDAEKAAADIDAVFPVEKTCAIIKPAAAGSKAEILAEIAGAGMAVVKEEESTMTLGAAKVFYAEHKEADFYEDLCTSMSSGPVTKLVLEARGVVAAWRTLIGPTDPSPEAEGYQAESLRAKYGTDATNNALHGSKDAGCASAEEGVLFETEMSVEEAAMPVEKTYAMIKPDAVGAGAVDAIVLMAENNGFTVVQRVDTEEPLSEEIVKEFYAEHDGKEFFETLVTFMTSGPVVKLEMERPNAIKAWRSLLGPTNPTQAKEDAPGSIRAQFGNSEDPEIATQNAAHGSDSPESAEREIGIMFRAPAEPAEEEE